MNLWPTREDYVRNWIVSYSLWSRLSQEIEYQRHIDAWRKAYAKARSLPPGNRLRWRALMRISAIRIRALSILLEVPF